MILEAIDKGPKEIEKLENSLWNRIEWGYQYTRAHRSALKLYLMHLEGRLLVEDEPLSLMKKAMKHSAGAETGTRKSKKSRKGQGEGRNGLTRTSTGRLKCTTASQTTSFKITI
jgi:hypothetical protein